MSSVLGRETDVQLLPTEDEPELGAVGFCGVILSAARRWYDPADEAYVIESLEFPITGMGHDWDKAILDFRRHATDHLLYLITLSMEDEISESETEVVSTLGPRLAVAYQRAYELRFRKRLRRSALRLGSRRKRGSIDWQSGTPKNSSQLLHA